MWLQMLGSISIIRGIYLDLQGESRAVLVLLYQSVQIAGHVVSNKGSEGTGS